MKLTVHTIFLALTISLFSNNSFSQVSIQSTKGYSVNVYVEPVALVINAKSCPSGYNYNLLLNYVITYTGSNIPKNLHALQGTITNNSVSHSFNLPNKQGTGSVVSHSNVWRPASDCATATLSAVSLKMINIEIEGDGISHRVVSYAFAGILPVKMVSFSAVPEQQKVKLQWQTATEINNDFFTVERSAGNNEWTAIKTVKGAGNSAEEKNYEVYDNAPVTGTLHYRIKQTDHDGKTSYSETRTVKYVSASNSVSLYPVPNTGNTINMTGITDFKNYELALLNTAGNLLYTTVISKTSVELPSLQKGIYFIRITNKLTAEATNLRYVKI
ncbi:T9SS type A sorting domain-containing protein [Terrimonas alba]|uniref:T9SS type A sorting domain-containing protein n=1 Tax=Terrimonas alba TaxID=3349636 RepID=UPI0035F4F670